MARPRKEPGIIPSARSLAATKRWKAAQKGQSPGNRASQRQQTRAIQQLEAGCTYGFGNYTFMTLPSGHLQFVN